jgi:hypothetical protein
VDQVNQRFLENHPEGVSTSTNADGMLPSPKERPAQTSHPFLTQGLKCR